MRLPWVSRFAYDGVRLTLDWLRDQYQQDRREWAAERGALVATLQTMQRAGFSVVAPVEVPPQEPELPAIVEAAILARMEPGGLAGRATLRWAREQLAGGGDPEIVARQIARGQTDDDTAD